MLHQYFLMQSKYSFKSSSLWFAHVEHKAHMYSDVKWISSQCPYNSLFLRKAISHFSECSPYKVIHGWFLRYMILIKNQKYSQSRGKF